ncbi:JNK1/MAPK8-associated membrane protein isoform X3 [Trachemys scripta elegans]|uniref:JNK1/MAPK8-associated membrane protein isoform X3 n=1 Tax=Trachemys scripta elegans TaxID=31138 RepID=UPI001555B37D|nr:JNK1/MAPK8-associated membrane protein isoform X3 [Trachemys scripta elegans]
MTVDIQPACLGLYCGRTVQYINASTEIYGDCGVCPRGQRTDGDKICRECTGSPGHYDWLYLGFMAMLPLILHWFFIEWYSGKKSSSALFQHLTALFECSVAAIVTLLVSDPVGFLYIRSCKVVMLSDWYTMLYNPSPDYITTVHCTHEAVYPLLSRTFLSGRKGLSFFLATGYFTPMESSLFPNWRDLARIYHCWLWYLHLPSFTYLQQSTPNLHASFQKEQMDIKCNLCQQPSETVPVRWIKEFQCLLCPSVLLRLKLSFLYKTFSG